MHFRAFGCALTVVLPFAYARTSQSGAKVCSGDIQGLCSQDFEVIGSTFGIILPPRSHHTSSPFEDDLIYKMVQALPYGSAGMGSDESNGTLHFVAAHWDAVQQLSSTPGISLTSNTLHGQVMMNGTSSQGSSTFSLQPPPAGRATSCSIRVSPFYLYTKQQITMYSRLQGCEMVRTASPTTVNFFRTDAAAVWVDSSMQSASFPIDGTMRTGSVLIDNLDKIRTSTEGYNAALEALQLDY